MAKVKKYKIAFVVKHFPSVSETFIMNQITDLIERGQEIKIYSVTKSCITLSITQSKNTH